MKAISIFSFVLSVYLVYQSAWIHVEHEEWIPAEIPQHDCLTWDQAKEKYGKLAMTYMVNQRCFQDEK